MNARPWDLVVLPVSDPQIIPPKPFLDEEIVTFPIQVKCYLINRIFATKHLFSNISGGVRTQGWKETEETKTLGNQS